MHVSSVIRNQTVVVLLMAGVLNWSLGRQEALAFLVGGGLVLSAFIMMWGRMNGAFSAPAEGAGRVLMMGAMIRFIWVAAGCAAAIAWLRLPVAPLLAGLIAPPMVGWINGVWVAWHEIKAHPVQGVGVRPEPKK